MANSNDGWESAPQVGGGSIPASAMALNDAMIQSQHPNWPSGGTAAQINLESRNVPGQTSSKGAIGLSQVIPSTLKNIEAAVGRKLNPNDPLDALEIHRYVINENMKHFGEDPQAAVAGYNGGWNPNNWNNPETQNYVQNFSQATGLSPQQAAQAAPIDYAPAQPTTQSNDSGWESAPAGNNDGWESAPAHAPQNNNSIWNNVKGLGLQAANLAAGGVEALPVAGAAAIGVGRRLLEGQPLDQALSKSYEQAGQNFQTFSPENALNKLGVSTEDLHNTLGYDVPSQVMNYLGKTLPHQLATAGTPESPFSAAQVLSPAQQKVAEPALGLSELVAPFLHRGGFEGRGEGAPAESVAKLAPDEAAAPSAAPPVTPWYAREQEPLTATSTGEVTPNQPYTPEQQYQAATAERAQTMAQQAAGDLFPGTKEGLPEAPYDGAAEQVAYQKLNPEPETPDTQMSLFEAGANGEVREPSPFIEAPVEHLDPTSGVDHPSPTEPEQPMAPNEFKQAVENLADRFPDKFSLPADMDTAYEKYTKVVDDEKGGVAAKSKQASEYAKAVTSEMLEQRVNNHPTVKANQARVDGLNAKLQDAVTKQGPTSQLRAAVDRAQATLDKSKENISKALGTDPYAPKAQPDGSVNMYTFGHLPTLMKSIGAILKAVHGVAFKTLDKLLPDFKNLDTRGQIIGQGIKNFVRKEATRDWNQTKNGRAIDQASKVPGLMGGVKTLNPHAFDELSPDELKAQFNSAQDLSDSKVGNMLRNNVLQGGLMLNDFSRHPLVKYVTDSVANAFRSSDKWTRENLLNKETGLRPMMKAMDTKEYTEIRTLMEANEGVKEFSEGELRGRGYSDAQIKYYTRSLELSKSEFTAFNAARVRAGESPVDPRIGHIAGYFTGDFKSYVKDADGRLIAVLGHNNRYALNTIMQRFKELHPDGDKLDFSKPELNRMKGASDTSFHGFMNILTELSKTNADVDRMVQAYRDVQMAKTNQLAQMANRGKFKRNASGTVGGAEGSKLWQSLEKNAEDGGKQQLRYLESVHKWTEFQNAISKSEDFIKDPEVNAPNAKAVSQAYLDNQMHRNLGALNDLTNAMTRGFADITGVGPSQLRGLASMTKTGMLNMFIGLGKFSHSLVTIMQPLWGIPNVNAVLRASGDKLGLATVTSHLKAMIDSSKLLQAKVTGSGLGDPFLKAASDYARDNDTFNTQQFNMGSVNHQPSKLGNLLHVNVAAPESLSRAYTYMYYSRMLKDINDGSMSDKEIFGTAHNAVQKVMADYGREAQAPVFNKMGFLGDLTRMLTTFKMNQISQAATASKMLGQGHVGPMITMLGTSLASAGLRGFIGYNIANGLLGQLTTWATKQGMMQSPTNLDQIILHMLHGKNQHLADALNFGATSGLGIDMTGSLSHADDIPDDPLGTLIPEGSGVSKVLGSAVQFAEHPNAQRGKALAYDAAPNSVKGVMENSMFTDQKGNYYDPHTGNLVANRSPADQMKRAFSFRPLDESKMRLEAEVGKGQKVQMADVRSEITKRALSDADSKSLTPQSFQQYAQQYFKNGGDPNELVNALVQHQGINKSLNIEQREAGLARGMTGAEKYQRAQELK